MARDRRAFCLQVSSEIAPGDLPATHELWVRTLHWRPFEARINEAMNRLGSLILFSLLLSPLL